MKYRYFGCITINRDLETAYLGQPIVFRNRLEGAALFNQEGSGLAAGGSPRPTRKRLLLVKSSRASVAFITVIDPCLRTCGGLGRLGALFAHRHHTYNSRDQPQRWRLSTVVLLLSLSDPAGRLLSGLRRISALIDTTLVQSVVCRHWSFICTSSWGLRTSDPLP